MSFKAILTAKLKDLGVPYTISGNEIRTICLNPEHTDHNPSYFINTITGVSHCFACGYKPHPAVLIGCGEAETEELLRQSQYKQYQETFTDDVLSHNEFTLPPKAYDINRDWRGVSQWLLEQLGVYYCDTGRYAGRLIFPIYQDNKCIGFDARIVNPRIVPEHLKDVKWIRPKGMHAQAIVYPMEYLRKLDCSTITICEGVMDAVSYLELDVPAIPTFGVSPPAPERITKLLELGCNTISIAYDNDEAGRLASQKVYKYYAEWFDIKNNPVSTKVYLSGLKDCNEYLVKMKGAR